MKRWPNILLFAAMVPLCWLLMMLVHEAGHVAGAWLSGGVVRLGTQLGVPTPANRFVYTALKLHENGKHPAAG